MIKPGTTAAYAVAWRKAEEDEEKALHELQSARDAMQLAANAAIPVNREAHEAEKHVESCRRFHTAKQEATAQAADDWAEAKAKQG